MIVRSLLATLLVLTGGHAALAGEAVAALAGSWKGAAQERSPGMPDAGSMTATITTESSGFRVDLQMGTLGSYQARFVETGHPGVYESKAGGMFAIFSTKPPPNPLQGGELVWAREEGPRLNLYRLDLPDGRMQLDQAILQAQGKTMTLRLEQRRSVADPEHLTAVLQRQGTTP